MKLLNKNKFIILFGVYLFTTIVSFSIFAAKNKTTIADISGNQEQIQNSEDINDIKTEQHSLLDIDPNAPKDQPCPLNGKMFTQVEKEAWSKRRPLAVMIENSPDARPQSGLSQADIVFEAVVEGGVTRFMPIFYCAAQADEIVVAPVRSARTYFVNLASGFNRPLYTHVGGANVPGETNALGQIRQYGWQLATDVDAMSVGYPTFRRNANRIPGKKLATEHTMVSSTELLWKVGEKRGWTNITPSTSKAKETQWLDGYDQWKFEDEAPEKGNISHIKYGFWSGYDNQYGVEWNYESSTNTYKRVLAGQSHIDLNNDEQIAANNVVVMFARERGPLNEEKHMIYDVVGKNKALIFKDGQAIEGKWSKKSRISELVFTNNKGKEIEFARGSFWISVISDDNEVTY
jgi:hypothetical protein